MHTSNHVEPGVRIECCRCHKSAIEDPDYVARGIHPATVAKHLMAIAVPLGWDFFQSAGKGFAVCPACVGGAYEPKAKCPMCGNRKVATTYCPGQRCQRGLAARHLHRTCQRCHYDWIQTTKADMPAAPAKVAAAAPVEHHQV